MTFLAEHQAGEFSAFCNYFEKYHIQILQSPCLLHDCSFPVPKRRVFCLFVVVFSKAGTYEGTLISPDQAASDKQENEENKFQERNYEPAELVYIKKKKV